MARIPEITSREELPQHKQHIFDAIVESRGRVVGLFALLLNSPELAGRTAHLGKGLAKILDVKVGDSLDLQTEAGSNIGEVAGFVNVAPHQPSAHTRTRDTL